MALADVIAIRLKCTRLLHLLTGADSPGKQSATADANRQAVRRAIAALDRAAAIAAQGLS